uniref:Birch protein n=1 Tax=Betula platyphylla TaxID=78630 RepID=A0A9E9L7A6_BETPL|nr:birch protein [Betula platyphylla]
MGAFVVLIIVGVSVVYVDANYSQVNRKSSSTSGCDLFKRRSSIAKRMVDQIITTSITDGTPLHANYQGDSLSLNQWQSLTCMLHKALPMANYTLLRTAAVSTFRFPAYDVSLMLSRNAFLVDIVREKAGRVLNLNSISSGNLWKGFDVLIFDTWHWWLHTGRKQPWDFVRYGRHTYKDMNRMEAYEKALITWARWVEANVDPNKTRVFFQGVSPDHMNPSEWGERNGENCGAETVPTVREKYNGGPHPAEVVLKKVLRRMSLKAVYLLKITGLSQLRKDGHPGGYGYAGHRGMDCTHWCLPGVPDTWNDLLYAALF